MVFSSLHFLLSFLPAFLLFYYLSPTKWKNATALLASLYFYAWGAPSFVFIILTSLLADYYLVQLVGLSEGRRQQRLLTLSLVLDVGLLVAAKYLNFIADNFNFLVDLFGGQAVPLGKVALPIGISFITFQKISYVMDCYHGRTKPLQNFFDYALYIMLFPQLIAGPIVRFNEVAHQIPAAARPLNGHVLLEGFLRFLLGLAKKVLIANTLGEVVDVVFATDAGQLNALTSWVGMLAYAFQIYFDFAGYSDMAIGLALMMGFRFPENFNFPYIAGSITEFWHRWHITLSSWMRDYLYIPLGGKRVSVPRLYVNLSVVFLISGLWHGAAWTFVIWGAYHGLFLILDRLFLLRWLERAGRIPAALFTFLAVLIGWVFFRSPTLAYAFQYLSCLFRFFGGGLEVFTSHRFWWALGMAAAFSFMGLAPSVEKQAGYWYTSPGRAAVKVVFSLLLGGLCLMEIYASGFNPFIYFKF